MDTLAFTEDYLPDNEQRMLNLITGFLNQVILLEASQLSGAGHDERTDGRKAHRNGVQRAILQEPA